MNWRKEDTPQIVRSLDELHRMMKVESGKATTHEVVKLHSVEYILSTIVRVDGIEESVKRRLITAVCFRLPVLKTHEPTTFRRVLAAGVRRHLKTPEHSFRIIFPLNVWDVGLEGMPAFHVQNRDFMVRSWSELYSQFAAEEWLQEAALLTQVDQLVLRRCFVPVEVTVQARGAQEAFRLACTGFELLRSVLNLDVMHKYTMQMGPPSCLAPMKAPPVYGVFLEDGQFDSLFIETEVPRKYDRRKLEPEAADRARLLLHELSSPRRKHSILDLIEEAVRKYGQALDTAEWRQAFLTLWQILELLTHEPNDNFNIRDVYRRTATLLGENALMRDVLECCYRARNDLVHRGHFSQEGLGEVEMLKLIVDRAIDRVYSLRHVCPDRHTLFLYYQTSTLSSTELETRHALIDAIRLQREQS